MRKLGLSDIRLVINRFDEKAVCKKKLLNIDDVIDAVCVQLIGIVPEDAAVSHCAVRGEPLPASSAAAKAFSRIAKKNRRRRSTAVGVKIDVPEAKVTLQNTINWL